MTELVEHEIDNSSGVPIVVYDCNPDVLVAINAYAGYRRFNIITIHAGEQFVLTGRHHPRLSIDGWVIAAQ